MSIVSTLKDNNSEFATITSNYSNVVRDLSARVHILPCNFPFALGQYADLYRGEIPEVGTEPEKVMQVALKVIRGVPFNDSVRDEFREGIVRALQGWASLDHPNIVPFLGIAYDIPYLATFVVPYYDRGNVISYLKDDRTIDVLALIKDVARGLTYLHSKSVVHSDIRGSNVLVDDSGSALLTDVGIAPAMNCPAFTTANMTGPSRWQAPEVLQFEGDDGRTAFSFKSDVYSFSMLMLEMITGERPFNHRRLDTVVIFDVIQGLRPKPVEEGIAQKLWPLLEECWEQSDVKRPEMSEVERRLKELSV